jgi:hypothetical protein
MNLGSDMTANFWFSTGRDTFIALELVVAFDMSLSFHVGVFTSRSMRSCTMIAELVLWLSLDLVL